MISNVSNALFWHANFIEVSSETAIVGNAELAYQMSKRAYERE